MPDANVLEIVAAHGPFMSDADEQEIIQRIETSDDVADLALRTCMCGWRLDGFDEYFEHLRAVVKAAFMGAGEHP